MKKGERGILTVEASIVLTLCTFFILFLFSFVRVYSAQSLVSHAVLQSSDAVALESYLREQAYSGKEAQIVELANRLNGSGVVSGDSFTSLRSADLPKVAKEKFVYAISDTESFAASRAVLKDVLDTPISPELLPPDAEGEISQQTEDLVGPYALHDFFLYHVMTFGFTPEKIYTLACRAFEKDFDSETVKKWLKNFYRRFFTQQFKRSCMPDGAKVGPLSLSPRGDWTMPSDASARVWLAEAEAL